MKNKRKPSFVLSIYIYPEADGGRNSDPLEVSIEGNNLFSLKKDIGECILDTCKKFKARSGEAEIDMIVEQNGEYYDHDETFAWISNDFSQVSFYC